MCSLRKSFSSRLRARSAGEPGALGEVDAGPESTEWTSGSIAVSPNLLTTGADAPASSGAATGPSSRGRLVGETLAQSPPGLDGLVPGSGARQAPDAVRDRDGIRLREGEDPAMHRGGLGPEAEPLEIERGRPELLDRLHRVAPIEVDLGERGARQDVARLHAHELVLDLARARLVSVAHELLRDADVLGARLHRQVAARVEIGEAHARLDDRGVQLEDLLVDRDRLEEEPARGVQLRRAR